MPGEAVGGVSGRVVLRMDGGSGCGGFGAYVPASDWGALEQYWALGFKGEGVRGIAEMRRVVWIRSVRVNRGKVCMLT